MRRARFYCQACGETFDEDAIKIVRHPATWGYYGGDPPTEEWFCPCCGEELCGEHNNEAYACETCGEPIVEGDKKTGFETRRGLCDTCGGIVDMLFDCLVDDVAGQFGVAIPAAREIAFDRAEYKDFYRGPK